MKSIKFLFPILILLFMASCGMEEFQEQANQQFGDQHFKTAISLIELHKIRTGNYPEKLKDLKHLGDWDRIIFNSVKYKKLEGGYQLDLTNGWMGAPENLDYSNDFWEGLGLKESNLKRNE